MRDRFPVGSKVRCIDARCSRWFWWFQRKWCGDKPVKGVTYTVAGYAEDNGDGFGPGLLLEEIRNFPFDGYYAPWRFRPVNTDISVFTKMLTSMKVLEAQTCS